MKKVRGPYALVASPQLPYNSEMEWSEMESECVKVFILTSLLIQLTGPSVANGLISPFGGFRSFSFTWPVALYI